MNAETAPIKYVFLDIVGFTKNRSVEAQADIVSVMNKVVNETLSSLFIPDDKLIVLPSGDGLCVALIDISNPFEIQLLIALGILERLDNYNSEIEDTTRRFQVRLGINENVDNLIIDYNKQRNVAGAGISLAQRIMEKADGGQILISQAVHETLRHREKYIKAFRSFPAKGKHGDTFTVYQYLNQGHDGLNIEIPSNFMLTQTKPKPLPKIVAYYIAQAISNRSFFLTKINDSMVTYSGVLLLYFLAVDSEKFSEVTPYDNPWRITWGSGRATIEEQLKHYSSIDSWVLIHFFRQIIEEKYLSEFYYCFEGKAHEPKYLFVSEKGQLKLKNDWPDIWKEFFGEQGVIE